MTLNVHQKMYLKALLLFLLSRIATAAYQPQMLPISGQGFVGSSVIFPVVGNVYPLGYYYVNIIVGQPPKPYFLDIDTGSDLTWLQCNAPCKQCTPAIHKPYDPLNKIPCNDTLCVAIQGPGLPEDCGSPPMEQCDYEVIYADSGSSLGILVKDPVSLELTNGTTVAPALAFGCGYDQQFQNPNNFTDGMLGLGPGNSSILKQLRDMGLTRDVVGHCLSGQGDGFLFFGDDFLNNSGIVWTPMLTQLEHYSVGSADLKFDDHDTSINGLQIVFDSGSTYTYFMTQAYNGLVSLINQDLKGKLMAADKDKSLPVCWKGDKPFKSISDVGSYFKTLELKFTGGKNVQFELSPASYLIVNEEGNVCLGILHGGENGLTHDINVIGDISVQDKLVIYDNENQQIGWGPSNCTKLPNS